MLNLYIHDVKLCFWYSTFLPKTKNSFLNFFPLAILTLTLAFPENIGETQYVEKKLSSKLNFYPVSINDSSSSGYNTGTEKVSPTVEKAVVIVFDRGYENQFTNAKPILDKYGFKASFFVICSFIEGEGYYNTTKAEELTHDFNNPMSWNQIRQLDKEGHDIGSHGTEHRDLRKLSSEELEYEVSGSKECLIDHGLEPTYFQYPFNKGVRNSTVLNLVSKNFDFGLSGHSRLMFLGCDGRDYGFHEIGYRYQSDCDPFSVNDKYTHTHKYAIKEWSHDKFHSELNKKNPNLAPHGAEINNMMFNEFVNVLNTQEQYNEKAGEIVAVPIVGYHSIGTFRDRDTSEELFDREMNYLHSNGFKVLTLTDLGYDNETNEFYIR